MPRKKAAPVEEEQTTIAAEPIPEEDVPLTEETPALTDRQQFFALDFNALDRDLTAEEQDEWNAIYASYRGRSALSGTVAGIDRLTLPARAGEEDRPEMYCAVVIPYRVRIVIPSNELWYDDHIPPDYVMRSMVGANISFIITRVEREAGFALASRKQAMRNSRYFFSHRPALCREGARLRCSVLAVGPRRCTVECYGHDIDLTQRELSYTAVPDLRTAYRPGEELDCVVKNYDVESDRLTVSVKETKSNPYDGAEFRHPVGSRRQAVIAGKYGGGVFCNLTDGTVCMCNYSYQYSDADFKIGDEVILLVHRFDDEKKQMFGKILSKR